MKDHEIAELVNRLTHIAREYGQTQQLRERIAHEIRPLCTLLEDDGLTIAYMAGYHDGKRARSEVKP